MNATPADRYGFSLVRRRLGSKPPHRRFTPAAAMWAGALIAAAAAAVATGIAAVADSGPAGASEAGRPSAYPASMRHLLEPAGEVRTPARLLEVKLVQDGTALTGTPPSVRGDIPLVLEASWLPMLEMGSSVPVRVVISDALGIFWRESAFRAGPERNDPAWQVGAEYSSLMQIDMREVANAFSGLAYVSIQTEGAVPGGRTYEPCFLLPVMVTPLVEPIRIGESLWRNELSPDVRVLDSNAKLGFGAEMQLPVPREWADGNRAVALVSALAYRSAAQGVQTAVLSLHGADGGTVSFEILSGVDTARCDFDAYGAGYFRHEKAEVFFSRDSAQLSAAGRPVQLHSYICLKDIPEDIGPIERITLACTAEVILEVQGIALVP